MGKTETYHHYIVPIRKRYFAPSRLDNIVTVECNMRFRFHLKNGKTHDFTLPDGVKVHRAIVWTSKKDKEEMTRVIIIPDDVECVEVLETKTT